jgi:hypothetical protein
MNSENPVLLTDEQMRSFITEGFLILKTDFPESFHQRLVEQLNYVYDQEGNPGNNLLPRIHDLKKVFKHPVITGALTSVLGSGYMMHTHRFGHFNTKSTAGGWHKDSYWGYRKIRNHHPWWAMIMYFPQDTPAELGPTGVMPGTHNYETRVFGPDESEGEALASGSAGTFALIHYDLWHRATANVLGLPRYMLKFEFMRTQAPTAPSWACQNPEWKSQATLHPSLHKHEAMWKETWNWLSGQVGSLSNSVQADDSLINEVASRLDDSFEPNALNAAYDLATMGTAGIQQLLLALRNDNVRKSRLAAYGLSIVGEGAVKGLVEALDEPGAESVAHAVFALGELRELSSCAVPRLVKLLKESEHPLIRYTVLEALAMIGAPSDQVVDGLIAGLQDDEVQVRFTAGLSLCRMGAAAAGAVPALIEALDDDNRYVRGHAAEALRHIGTDEAKDTLIDYLFDSRWCPITTPQSPFKP